LAIFQRLTHTFCPVEGSWAMKKKKSLTRAMDKALVHWQKRCKLQAGHDFNIAWRGHLKELNNQIKACLDDESAFWGHSVRILGEFIDQEELSWALTTILNTLFIHTWDYAWDYEGLGLGDKA
jgi:hypothetical protein